MKVMPYLYNKTEHTPSPLMGEGWGEGDELI
jgi:hypothetical protein